MSEQKRTENLDVEFEYKPKIVGSVMNDFIHQALLWAGEDSKKEFDNLRETLCKYFPLNACDSETTLTLLPFLAKVQYEEFIEKMNITPKEQPKKNYPSYLKLVK